MEEEIYFVGMSTTGFNRYKDRKISKHPLNFTLNNFSYYIGGDIVALVDPGLNIDKIENNIDYAVRMKKRICNFYKINPKNVHIYKAVVNGFKRMTGFG